MLQHCTKINKQKQKYEALVSFDPIKYYLTGLSRFSCRAFYKR